MPMPDAWRVGETEEMVAHVTHCQYGRKFSGPPEHIVRLMLNLEAIYLCLQSFSCPYLFLYQ